VADERHVCLVGVEAAGEAEHLVVRLLEWRAGPKQPEPQPHAVDVGIHRHVVAAEGEQQHAGRRLSPDAG
jgi:hypothetical protein